MTLVVGILARAARQCSVTPPSNWISATEDTHLAMRDDYMEETVADVLERIDWPSPIGRTTTVSGASTADIVVDGEDDDIVLDDEDVVVEGSGTTVEAHPLPADFKRLTRDEFAVYEAQRTRRRAMPVSSSGEWEFLKEIGSTGSDRYYRLRGYEGAYEIDFYRALETGSSATVSYISTHWLTNAGATKASFTDLADVAMLPRRIIECGIVWRFRERRGLPADDKLAEYEAMLARAANDHRVVRKLNMGTGLMPGIHYPPVPDFIPASS